jgi:hypothetical protein
VILHRGYAYFVQNMKLVQGVISEVRIDFKVVDTNVLVVTIGF